MGLNVKRLPDTQILLVALHSLCIVQSVAIHGPAYVPSGDHRQGSNINLEALDCHHSNVDLLLLMNEVQQAMTI